MNVAEFLSLTKLKKKKKEKKKEKKSQLSYVSKTITKFWETEDFFFSIFFKLWHKAESHFMAFQKNGDT